MAAPIVVNAAYSVDKKIIKKLNRCRHTLRKLDNIDISEEATNVKNLFISIFDLYYVIIWINNFDPADNRSIIASNTYIFPFSFFL